MKKRIGSKLYDTEKSECVLPEQGLYKRNKSQSYFYYDGNEIRPVDFSIAEKILTDNGIKDITLRKPSKYGFVSLHVSSEAADHLAAYCRSHGVTQKKVIEDFIATLVP